MIEILDTLINIDKFEMSNLDYKNPLSGRVQFFTYVLSEKDKQQNYWFGIRINFYGTNIETDFILDADISCKVYFFIETLVPTTTDLYHAYKQANRFANIAISERVLESGITNWENNFENVPIEIIEIKLNECIEKILLK